MLAFSLEIIIQINFFFYMKICKPRNVYNLRYAKFVMKMSLNTLDLEIF